MLLLVGVICLGLAVLLVPTREIAGAAGPVSLLDVSPGRVAGIAIAESGVVRRLTRRGPDDWIIELPGPDGQPVRWPASMARVRGFLRILDRLGGVEEPGQAAWVPSATLTVTDDAGEASVIEIDSGTLGGRSRLRVDSGDGAPRTYLASDEITRLATGKGIASWVDARPFAAIEGAVSAIEVRSGLGDMSIVRSGSGWRIERPFEAPAETALVDELLVGLRTLAMTEVGAGEPGEMPEGSTAIEIRSERRSPDGAAGVSIERATHRLETVGQAGSSGLVSIAAIVIGEDGVSMGPVVGRMRLETLTGAVRRPGFYIARRALAGTPGTVETVAIETPGGASGRWARTASGWQASGGEPAAPEVGDRLDELMEIMMLLPAEVCAWVGDGLPEGSQVLGRIVCAGPGGAEIGSWRLVAAPLPGPTDDTRVHAALVGGGVARFYTPEQAVEIVRWVVGLESGGG